MVVNYFCAPQTLRLTNSRGNPEVGIAILQLYRVVYGNCGLYFHIQPLCSRNIFLWTPLHKAHVALRSRDYHGDAIPTVMVVMEINGS